MTMEKRCRWCDKIFYWKEILINVKELKNHAVVVMIVGVIIIVKSKNLRKYGLCHEKEIVMP